MLEQSFKLRSCTNKNIHIYKWSPTNDTHIRGVVQIVHGSIEHSYRYKRFAEELVNNGYIVYANDHIGHGKSIHDEKFYFSNKKNGLNLAIKDLETINKAIQKHHENKKIFIFGHSMGSFMVRKLLKRTNARCDGAIICGTGGPNTFLLNTFITLAKADIFLHGRKNRNKLLHAIVYGSVKYDFFNKGDQFEFITNDILERNKYKQDQLCGDIATTEYLMEMAKLVKWSKKKKNNQMKIKRPIIFISGANDMVGGKNSKYVIDAYKKYAMNANLVQIKLYKDARHELLNELNRDIVTKDILDFLEYCEIYDIEISF